LRASRHGLGVIGSRSHAITERHSQQAKQWRVRGT